MKRLLWVVLLMLTVSCNMDDETQKFAPEVDFAESAYSLKVGGSITLQPTVANIDGGAKYEWREGSTLLATTLSYTYVATKKGTFYLSFTATNEMGSDTEEVRIEVDEVRPPVIGFATEGSIMTLEAGVSNAIVPDIFSPTEYTLEWLLDGNSVSTEPHFTKSFATSGSHNLTLRATNEDGTTERSLTLEVVAAAEGRIYMPAERHTTLGRTLYIDAAAVGFSSPTYAWSIAGNVVATTPIFAYTGAEEGTQEVKLEVSDSKGRHVSRTIPIHTHPAEGHYKREATAQSRATVSKVFEYSPAPGQFINESKSGFGTITTAAEAAVYAEGRLSEQKYLSLGGWGGYIVAGFDHSVECGSGEGYDFSITGNMYTTSSEPGIVFVMQDSNGNGLPDDEWYELKGSEWGKQSYTAHYAVTYYRSVAAGMGVLWRDCNHRQGLITRNATHTHDYYYPLWLTADSYTLYGPMLAPNSEVNSSGIYADKPYSWGYADNLGSDRDQGGNDEATALKNYFKIANAINADGSPAGLKYIDFVKVQCAINYVSGPNGEISTDVLAITDERLK